MQRNKQVGGKLFKFKTLDTRSCNRCSMKDDSLLLDNEKVKKEQLKQPLHCHTMMSNFGIK